jgi:WD40 repeat protein
MENTDMKGEKGGTKGKFPIKIILIVGVILLLLLIIGYIIARPEILKGNFDLDYLLFRQSTDVETTDVDEDESAGADITDETEPVLVWSITHEDDIYSIAVSPEDDTVGVGIFLASYIRHLSDGNLEDVILYDHTVDDMEFSPDGTILASGLGVGGVFLAGADDGSEIHELGSGYNSRLAFSPDGDTIATGNREGVVWLWNVDSGQKIADLEESETSWVSDLDFHPSGDLLAASHWGKVGSTSYVNIWDIEKGEVVRMLDLKMNVDAGTDIFSFSPDGELMAVADIDDSWEYHVYLRDVESGEVVREWAIDKNPKSLEFSPDGSYLAVGVQGAPVTVREVETGTVVYTLDQTGFELGVSNWVYELTFTPDGKHIVVSRADNSLELWRLPGGEPIASRPREITNPPPLPSDVLFGADQAVLKESAYPELESFAEELYGEFPEATITFVGHTTSFSSNEDGNVQLSTQRAEAVKTWFESWAESNDVDGWVLLAEGKGSSELKVPDRDAEGNFLSSAAAVNRRVEILIEVDE